MFSSVYLGNWVRVGNSVDTGTVNVAALREVIHPNIPVQYERLIAIGE